MKRIIILIQVFALVACTIYPTDRNGRKLTLEDVGPPPADVAEAVRNALRYQLKDFDSAKIEIPVSPRPVVFAKAPGLNNGGAGWEICPMVNAKNSYGAYVGFSPAFILWNKGEVIDIIFSKASPYWCGDDNSTRALVGPRLK